MSPILIATDGGCVGKNPSREAGTWAFVLVGSGGQPLAEGSGVITPDLWPGLPWVSCNLAETYAALMALRRLPAGWLGRWHCDSLNAIRAVNRARRGSYPGFLPDPVGRELVELLKTRLPRPLLVGGHPSREELAAGRRKKDGKPTCHWNVKADGLCRAEAVRFHNLRPLGSQARCD